MKKLFSKKLAIYLASILFILSVTILSSILVAKAQADDSLSTKLSGRILLQVEDNGEAWYLNPDNQERYFMGRPADAFSLMRSLGLGISEDNYNIFKNNGVPIKYSGKILLRVEKSGEAYYVNPENLEMNYLGRPSDAFKVMRELGLGITNDNLNKINRNNNSNNNNTESEVDENTEITLTTHKPELMTNFTRIINLRASIEGIDNISEKGILYKYTAIEDEELIPSLDDYDQKVVDSSSNVNIINIDLNNLKSKMYPYIRAYVIDNNNKIYYGNIETIDSIGERGTPAMPKSGSGSEEINEEDGVVDQEPEYFTLTYSAPERDVTYTTSEGGYVKLGDFPLWEEKEPLAVARTAPGSAVIDGKIYVVGGTDDWDDNNYFSVYDPETDTWDETKTPMHIFRNAPLVVELNGQIYAIGGRNDNNDAEASAEVYDIETDTWTYIASTSIARNGPVGGVYNGEIYAVGGMDVSSAPDQSIEIYNPETNTWRDGGTIPFTKTGGATSQIVGNTLYVIGGHDGGGGSDNLFSYNLDTRIWNTELEKLPVLRGGGNSFYYNGKLYYLGGTDTEWIRSENIFEYDTETDTWKRSFNLPNKIHRPAVEIVDGYLYIIGGLDNDWNSINTNYKQSIFNLVDSFEASIYQTVLRGNSSQKVYAFYEPGYRFDSWSDGVTDNPRIDTNIEENIDVEAVFIKDDPSFDNPDDSLILEFNMLAGEKLTLPISEPIFPFFSIGENGYLNYFNFIVDWGDESEEQVLYSGDGIEKSHTYTEAGDYQVSISGNFPYIDFLNFDDSKNYITGIIQWGDVDFQSLSNAFYNCSNLSSLPDGPITGAESITDFTNTFYNSSLNSIPDGLFNLTPNVRSFDYTFYNNSLTSIPSGLFDHTPDVIRFDGTFYGNSLSSIPAGLFDHNPNVISFSGWSWNGTFANNSISSIPAGLFDNNTKVTSFDWTFSANSLSSIPANLFDHTPNVTSFSYTFYDNLITAIPSGLFDHTPNVTSFSSTFYINSLSSIPANLFDHTPNVTSFHFTFHQNLITTIPDGLFDHTPNVISFSNTFSTNSLNSIPDGLFDYTPNVTTFAYTFHQNLITTIPAGLFNHTPNAIYFTATFHKNSLSSIPEELFNHTPNAIDFQWTFGSSSITTIPANLFASVTLATDFSATFWGNHLITIPSELFDHNLNVSNFVNTFGNNSTLTGDAPTLWLRDPEPNGIQCFSGATGLDNYGDIPVDWK